MNNLNKNVSLPYKKIYSFPRIDNNNLQTNLYPSSANNSPNLNCKFKQELPYKNNNLNLNTNTHQARFLNYCFNNFNLNISMSKNNNNNVNNNNNRTSLFNKQNILNQMNINSNGNKENIKKDNIKVLNIEIDLNGDKTISFCLSSYDDILLVVKQKLEEFKLKESLFKCIILKIMKSLSTIYTLYNRTIQPEEKELLNRLQALYENKENKSEDFNNSKLETCEDENLNVCCLSEFSADSDFSENELIDYVNKSF